MTNSFSNAKRTIKSTIYQLLQPLFYSSLSVNQTLSIKRSACFKPKCSQNVSETVKNKSQAELKTHQKRKSYFWMEKIESKNAFCVFRENQKRKIRFWIIQKRWTLKTIEFSNLKTLSFFNFKSKNPFFKNSFFL